MGWDCTGGEVAARRGVPQAVWGGDKSRPGVKCKDTTFVQKEKKGLRGDLSNPYKHLQRVSGWYQTLPSDSCKIKHNFHLSRRKNFFHGDGRALEQLQGGPGVSLSGDISNPPG